MWVKEPHNSADMTAMEDIRGTKVSARELAQTPDATDPMSTPDSALDIPCLPQLSANRKRTMDWDEDIKNPAKNLPTSMYEMETRPKLHRPDPREARMKASDVPVENLSETIDPSMSKGV